MKISELFDGIDQNDYTTLINCLGGIEKTYSKDNYILLAGDTVDYVGVILSGKVKIIKEDFFGTRNIIAELGEGDVFGEAFACAGVGISNETVQASTDCRIMMIQFKKLVTTCSNACAFHSALIANMLKIVAKKNIHMSDKMEIISKRTTREKIMTYLLSEAEKKHNQRFEIPFSRNELADYLCVERSAMSRELSKMQQDKLIRYTKNNFELLESNFQ